MSMWKFMAKVKVVLNKAGVRELLKSDEMMGACNEQAEKITAKAGEGFGITTRKGKRRVVVQVKTETKAAYFRCIRGNILLKCLRS